MSAHSSRYVPIAEVSRNGFVESVHFGSLVITNPDGSVREAYGDPDAAMLSRSSMKLAQATAILELDADRAWHDTDSIPSHLVALIASSHSGEYFHQDGVRELLTAGGLTEAELSCTPKWPFDDATKNDLLNKGAVSTASIYADCSGKHAGMLLACLAQGWTHHNYLDVDHPLQEAIRAVVERQAQEKTTAHAVDGCGAPVFATSLTGLARMFGAARTAPAHSHAHRVAAAMATHPEYVGGTTRDITRLMRAVPGLVAKEGAEGVLAASLADGTAIAVKTSDGSMRAWPVVGAAAIATLVKTNEALDELLTAPVFGGGRSVGQIRSLLHR